MSKTWKELEAEGVKRCCACFKGGGQCRRRAVKEYDFDWCAKHGPFMEAETKRLVAILKKESQPKRDDEDEDGV